MSKEKYDEICMRLGAEKEKVSAVERKKKISAFAKDLGKSSKECSAEQAAGVMQTAYVAGAVALRILTKANKLETVVDAEIKKRKIKVSRTKLNALNMAEKRKLLRVDELKNRHREELKETEIKYIVPESDEMKNIMTDSTQQKILDKINGLLALDV